MRKNLRFSTLTVGGTYAHRELRRGCRRIASDEKRKGREVIYRSHHRLPYDLGLDVRRNLRAKGARKRWGRNRSVIYDLDWVSNWTTRRYQIGWSKL